MNEKNGNGTSLGAAALKGAVAGAVGGAALLVAELIERELMLPRGADKTPVATAAVEEVTREHGKELGSRAALATGIGVQLAYCAIFGALYGVAHTQIHGSSTIDGLAIAGMAYSAAIPNGGVLPRMGMAPPSEQSIEQVMVPVGSHLAFGVTTAAVFATLA